jgi:hypothetical protein
MNKAPAPGQVRAQRLAHMNGHSVTNLKGNIMIDNALLKRIAAETIPESLNSDSPSKDQLAIEQWLQIRREAGLRIDAETAEVRWIYAQTLDPYGVIADLPVECQQVGREYFARSPGSDVWVSFDDLPDETRKRIWESDRPKSDSMEWPIDDD